MSYQIDAQLNEDQAQLRLIEAETGRVRLAWECPMHDSEATDEGRVRLQRLFRELMLLSTLDRLR